jgi:hypothetical protein
MLRHRHTVTFFQLGARVFLDSAAPHGGHNGVLIGIGWKFLKVRLDSGRIVRRIWPSWITRELKWKETKPMISEREMDGNAPGDRDAETGRLITQHPTYGEKAVGLTFNPSGDPLVNEIKVAYAKIIDLCNDLRALTGPNEKARLLSVAITEAQTAQMWAVKGITYRY